MNNPLNPTSKPVEDEVADAIQATRETVDKCERLMKNPDFQWLWATVLAPQVNSALKDSQNESLPAKQIKVALRRFNVLNDLLKFPGAHAADGRKAIQDYERRKAEAQRAQELGGPKLKPGFQE